MLLWSAFLMGLLGSLHCAGMCGPLVLALPVVGKGTRGIVASRLAYHGGRIAVYAALGVVLGALGKSLVLAGLQRWLSIGAGVALLAGVWLSTKTQLGGFAGRGVFKLKAAFCSLLQQRTYGAMTGLGALNGLLPCGLVYAAATASLASASVLSSVQFMTVFGMGTLPMMLGLGLVGRRIPLFASPRFQKLIPLGVCLVGVVLIVRGLALDLPWFSPAADGSCPGCKAAH